MTASATEPRLDTALHDPVLALALGGLSVSRQFAALVSAPAPGLPPLARDDALVLAALGIISLGRSLHRWLEEASEPVEPRAVSPSADEAPHTGDLLR